jgi:murein DD-endopeptidase
MDALGVFSGNRRLVRAVLVAVAILATTAGAIGGQMAANGRDLAGSWEGTLGQGAVRLRIVLTIEKQSDGNYKGSLNSVDQRAVLPMNNIALKSDAVHFEISPVGGTYDGTLSTDGNEIAGTWTQTGVPPQPLKFTRAAPGAAAAQAPANQFSPSVEKPFTVPFDIVIPVAPTAFKGDGKWHLAYELHIANLSDADCQLTSIETITGDSAATAIAKFSGVELQPIVTHPGQKAEDPAKIAAGTFAVVYMWATVDRLADVPGTIRQRMTVKVGKYPEDVTMETPPAIVGRAPVTVIAPPLRGDGWLAGNGPSNTSVHRRALIPIDGRAYISQRFAIDWVQLHEDGKTYRGDPLDNKNYRAYGTEIHSVADGTVTEVKDGIPQNTPGATSRAVPITLETIGGNHVIVQIGPGLFAFYAHMQPGSIRVKMGDKVNRGQVLGLVGNTGNSSEPHLHFDICDASSMLACEGLPYAFQSFEVEGSGWGWKSSDSHPAPVKHEMEIPLENEVVIFPSAP